MNCLDIDTRTDVYSLGVLLYELVAGVLPYDEASFSRATPEIRRIIREEEPLRPSERFNRSQDSSVSIARNRGCDPRTLARSLKGDIDWIVVKALQKDRTRRYPTASEFAADVLRHLNRQPIMAATPSSLYRIRKMLKRHLLALAAAMSVLLAIGTTLVIKIAHSNRVLLETRTALAAAEVEKAELDEARQRDAEFESRLSAANSAAAAHAAMGQEQRAVEVYRSLMEDLGSSAQSTHPSILESKEALAQLYARLGNIDEAEALLVEVTEARQRTVGGPNEKLVQSMSRLAQLCEAEGRFEHAEELLLRAHQILSGLLGSDDERVTMAEEAVGRFYERWGRSSGGKGKNPGAVDAPSPVDNESSGNRGEDPREPGDGFAPVQSRPDMKDAEDDPLNELAFDEMPPGATRTADATLSSFLVIFAKYVSWQDSSFEDDSAPFVIAVVGSAPIGQAIARLTVDKQLRGRSVVARYFASLSEFPVSETRRSHLVFIRPKDEHEMMQLLESRGSLLNTLTVSEFPGFATAGGVVELRQEDGRYLYRLNTKAAKKAELRLSAQLLRLASEIVDR